MALACHSGCAQATQTLLNRSITPGNYFSLSLPGRLFIPYLLTADLGTSRTPRWT